MAYADYYDLIELTEELITTLVNEVHGQGTVAIPYRLSLTDERTLSNFSHDPWKRMTYRDAVREHLGAKPQEITDPAFALAQAKQHHCELKGGESYWQLLSLLFEELVEPTLINPTFITDFPVELSPLAKRNAADPELTDRFELFIAGREIANAFSELNDPLDQRKRPALGQRRSARRPRFISVRMTVRADHSRRDWPSRPLRGQFATMCSTTIAKIAADVSVAQATRRVARGAGMVESACRATAGCSTSPFQIRMNVEEPARYAMAGIAKSSNCRVHVRVQIPGDDFARQPRQAISRRIACAHQDRGHEEGRRKDEYQLRHRHGAYQCPHSGFIVG